MLINLLRGEQPACSWTEKTHTRNLSARGIFTYHMSNDSSISSGNDDNLAAIASPVMGSPSTLNPAMNMNALLAKKSIDLSYQGLTDANVDVLIDVLNHDPTRLTQLNLYGNRLTFANANLAIALGACTSLAVLSLGDNDIGPDGAANVADHIIAATASLVELHMGDNNIADTGTISIANALCNNDTIRLLGLYGNRIGDVGAASLANTAIAPSSFANGGESGSMNTNTNVLREIWLHNNHIGDVGGKAIVDALRSSSSNSTSIENICLINNKISSDISTVIRTVLADRKKEMMTPAAPVMMAEDVVVVVEEETMKKVGEEVSAAAEAAAAVLLPQPTSPTSSVVPHGSTSSSAPAPPSSPTAEQVAVVVREALSRDVLNTLKAKDLEITKLSTALELERERSHSKDVEIAMLKAKVMQMTAAKVMQMTAEPVAVVDVVTPPPSVLWSSSLVNDELPSIVGNVSLKDTSAVVVGVGDSSNSVAEIYEDTRDETEENSDNDTLHITISVE